jgi:23S rRNA pseudouridine2605 synthase
VFVTSKYGKGAWLNVTLKEGYKRQIREMGKVTGLPVVRIVRVRIGDLRLGNLKPKEWRYLTPQEVDDLKKLTRSQRSNLESSKKAIKAFQQRTDNKSTLLKKRKRE